MTSRAWAAFGTVAILWGVPYFFIKVAVGEVSPSVVAWSRLACCFYLLLPDRDHHRRRPPDGRAALAALRAAFPATGGGARGGIDRCRRAGRAGCRRSAGRADR